MNDIQLNYVQILSQFLDLQVSNIYNNIKKKNVNNIEVHDERDTTQ